MAAVIFWLHNKGGCGRQPNSSINWFKKAENKPFWLEINQQRKAASADVNYKAGDLKLEAARDWNSYCKSTQLIKPMS